ncbi:MAG: hypothetical protein AB1349_00500 [Elusimicrobiota bacterium]
MKKLFAIRYSLFAVSNGAALVTALIFLVFLSGIGIALVVWLTSESKQATHKKLVTADLYLAEAGTEKVVYLLRSSTAIAKPFLDDLPNDTTTFTYFIRGTSVVVTIDDIP